MILATGLVLLALAHGQVNRPLPQLVVQQGVKSDSSHVVFSPNGAYMLIGTPKDDTQASAVRIWDLRTMRQLRTIGNLKSLWPFEFSPDGKTLLLDNWVWDASTWTRIRKLPYDTLNEISSTATAYSPQGDLVASLGQSIYTSSFIRVAETNTKDQMGSFAGQSFTPDGKGLVVAYEHGAVLVDSATGTEKQTWQIPGDTVSGIAMMADAPIAVLISTKPDAKGRIYKLDSRKSELQKFDGDFGHLYRIVKIGTRHKFLVQTNLVDAKDSTAYSPKYNSVFEVDGDNLSAKPVLSGPNFHQDIAISPDGALVAVRDYGRTRVFDRASETVIFEAPTINSGVRSVGLDDSGNFLAAGYNDGATRIWDVKNWRLLHTYPTGRYESTSAAVDFLPSSSDVMTIAGANVLQAFDAGSDSEAPKRVLGIPDLTYTPDVWTSPSGRYQVVGKPGQSYRLLDIDSSTVLGSFTRPPGTVTGVSVCFGKDEAKPFVLTVDSSKNQTTIDQFGGALSRAGVLPFEAVAPVTSQDTLFAFSFSPGHPILSKWDLNSMKPLAEVELPIPNVSFLPSPTLSVADDGTNCAFGIGLGDAQAHVSCFSWDGSSKSVVSLYKTAAAAYHIPICCGSNGQIILLDEKGVFRCYDHSGSPGPQIPYGALIDAKLKLSPSGKFLGVTALNQYLVADLAAKKALAGGYAPYGLENGLGEIALRFAADEKTVKVIGSGSARTLNLPDMSLASIVGSDTGTRYSRVTRNGKWAATFQNYYDLTDTNKWFTHVRVWDLGKNRIAWERAVPGFVQSWELSPAGDTLLGLSPGHLITVSKDGGTPVDKPLNPSFDFLRLELEGALMVGQYETRDTYPIEIIARQNGKQPVTISLPGHDGRLTAEALYSKNLVLATGGADARVILWDLKKSVKISTLEGHEGAITGLAFTPDGSRLFSSSLDGTIRLWDVNSGSLLATLAASGDREFVVQAGGYYMASRDAAGSLGFRVGDRAFEFDQFDVSMNRPDLVATSLGAAPENIALLKKALTKRLTRLWLSATDLTKQESLPEVKLSLKSDPSQPSAQLALDATGSDLNRVFVTLNEVPVRFTFNGSPGAGTSALRLPSASNHIHGDLTVSLAPGLNKLQVAVGTVSGTRSIRETRYILRPRLPEAPALWIVSVGVSHYATSEHDLKFADKDANSIAERLSKKNKLFRESHVLCLTNEQATHAEMGKIHQFLSASGPNDTVVMFVAGHGLVDSDLTYYFATYDVDFQKPKIGGVSYGELEAMLDDIPALQKLLLMDTCHSGEIDTERGGKDRLAVGIAQVGSRSQLVSGEPLQTTSSFELMLQMFSDPSFGTGTAVLGASGGAEYAYEKDGHGLFTRTLLDILDAKESYKDGVITVSTIQRLVSQKVSQLTGGAQVPTSRRAPAEFDFAVCGNR